MTYAPAKIERCGDPDWLREQLAEWPKRVDSGRTTNIEFLMKAAAAELDYRAEKAANLTGALLPFARAQAMAKKLSTPSAPVSAIHFIDEGDFRRALKALLRDSGSEGIAQTPPPSSPKD